MLLAIDVGNTSINVGFFKDDRLSAPKRVITKKNASLKYYRVAFKTITKNKKIKAVIIASVVPQVTTILDRLFKKYFKLKPIILGVDLIVPIKNLYKNPKKVGQDRLVNAYAGYKKYGGGLIIIDFGTAVTFDVVSKKGAYLGGIIVPGIELSLNTLTKKAVLLPRIKIKESKMLIGKDTKTSMVSGILNGYGALCAGLVNRIKKEAGEDYRVILTGGHARTISKFCGFKNIQPNLTFEGLRLIYKFSLTKKSK